MSIASQSLLSGAWETSSLRRHMVQPSLKIRLLPRAESAVRRGHPWVFAESIKEQNREAATGELAVLYDRQDRMLALALYDAHSPIRLRIVHCGPPAQIDRAWWLARAREAFAKRESIAANGPTDGYRCIHGENDGFPGLVADRYADTLVVKLYSSIWLPRWNDIGEILSDAIRPRHRVLRVSRNMEEHAAQAGLSQGYQEQPGPGVVIFQENGIRFEADVLRGQKTGFFLDQRDNRARVETMARGRDVLNLFSFSGGFSLYAARGGANRVVDVDISPHALENARRNFSLNPSLCQVPHEGIQADVFEWLRAPGDSFDLVITDPPRSHGPSGSAPVP